MATVFPIRTEILLQPKRYPIIAPVGANPDRQSTVTQPPPGCWLCPKCQEWRRYSKFFARNTRRKTCADCREKAKQAKQRRERVSEREAARRAEQHRDLYLNRHNEPAPERAVVKLAPRGRAARRP